MEFIELLLSDRNVSMQYEMAAMLLLLGIPAFKTESDKLLKIIWGAVFLGFTYLHRALLPFLVSGLWLFIICGTACAFYSLSIRAFLRPAGCFAVRIGMLAKRNLRPYGVLIILMILIQVCRMNVAVDYDSLRYGLRSDVLLSDDGIAGFFKSIGLVNTVYTYPKGYEVLTLPLKLISAETYGYVLCFNIWMLIAVLLIIGEIVRAVTGIRGDRASSFAMAAAALIPGITNMSVTAKSDLITLFCQLAFILSVVLYLKKKDGSLTGIGAGALILSFSFKPTSMIFSSAAGLTALAFLAVRRIGISLDLKGLRALIPAAIYTGIMTLRTFLITGLPVTSIFTGMLSRLGFELKYPFREQQAFDSAAAGITADRIEAYIRRVLQFFLCPSGEDMEHVIMAWGGLVFFVLLVTAVILFKKTVRGAEEMLKFDEIKGSGQTEAEVDGSVTAVRFLYVELFAVSALSFISLWLLYQVDGNYFGLWYAAAVITGTISVISVQAGIHEGKKEKRAGGAFGAVFLSAAMVHFTAFTGWNGACGFTPADPLNRGYYNHAVIDGIINPLGWDKHTRVVAFAYEPECYNLVGRVESWVDIDGSGGNVYLTDTKLDIFKEYLSFADIDYIYADLDFLKDSSDPRHERAGVLFKYLLEDGCFEDVVLSPGSSTMLFCRIDKERAKVSWEIDMGEERRLRTEDQLSYLEGIT